MVLASLCSVLQSCSKARDAFGLNRHQPDEFTTPMRSGLEAPTTLSLEPPQQGAPRRGQIIANDRAQQILEISGSNNEAAMSSAIEQELLLKARTNKADSTIRQEIWQDNLDLPQEKPLINKLLFWQHVDDPSHKVINATKERDEYNKNINNKVSPTIGNDDDQNDDE